MDVSVALEKITLLCGHMDLRTRNLEATVFITIETLPTHPQVISGQEGSKQQYDEVVRANKERWTKIQKK